MGEKDSRRKPLSSIASAVSDEHGEELADEIEKVHEELSGGRRTRFDDYEGYLGDVDVDEFMSRIRGRR